MEMKNYLNCLWPAILLSCTSITSNSKMPSQAVRSRDEGTSQRSQILEKAEQYLGVHYKRDGKHPSEGFDCSGFVSYVFNQFGLNLRGGSSDIASVGLLKNTQQIEVGDVVFFGERRHGKLKINHVGIVAHSSEKELVMIHSSSSLGISKEDILKSDYWKSRFLFVKDILKI